MRHAIVLPLLAVLAACGGADATTGATSPAPPEPEPRAAPSEPEIDPETAAEIDRLILRLTNLDPAVRIRAANDLAAHGPDAREALGFLLACLVEDEIEPARACSAAIVAIDDPAAVPLLERAVASRPERRTLARATLDEIR